MWYLGCQDGEAQAQRPAQRIRQAVRTGRLVYTAHAIDRMRERGFSFNDVEYVLLGGASVEETWDEDHESWRVVVLGTALDGVEAEAVCAVENGTVINTMYEVSA